MAAKIKKGDRVVVLTGKDKGRTGNVLKVLPSENRVVVEGVNMVQRHTRPSQADPQGGIKNKEASLHLSNVAIADANGKAVALGLGAGILAAGAATAIGVTADRLLRARQVAIELGSDDEYDDVADHEDVAVEAGQHLIEELDAGHLRAQPAPHAAELQPDHALAHAQHLRIVGEHGALHRVEVVGGDGVGSADGVVDGVVGRAVVGGGAAVAGALIYVMNPLDVIPDLIFGFGLVDDAGVVTLCLKLVESDIHRYAAWKEQQEESQTGPVRID